MEPQPVAEPTPAPAPTRPVRAAAQKAADKKAAEAEAAAKIKELEVELSTLSTQASGGTCFFPAATTSRIAGYRNFIG